MSNYKAILDYYHQGNTTMQIAKLCECSRTTVLKTIKRAKAYGIELPLSYKISDLKLLETFYPERVRNAEYEVPDFYELEKDSLSLNITEEDNSFSVDLAIEVAEHFGIDKNEAFDIANDMLIKVRENWRGVAEKNGLSKSAIAYMRPAFAATEM